MSRRRRNTPRSSSSSAAAASIGLLLKPTYILLCFVCIAVILNFNNTIELSAIIRRSNIPTTTIAISSTVATSSNKSNTPNTNNKNDNNKYNNKFNNKKLRYDWLHLEPKSILAKKMKQHQLNCNIPLGNFRYRKNYGLGSDLHIWGQGLCNAIESNVRIRTLPTLFNNPPNNDTWSFYDQLTCNNSSNTNNNSEIESPMKCYFPNTELLCPNDYNIIKQYPTFHGNSPLLPISTERGKLRYNCPSIIESIIKEQEEEIQLLQQQHQLLSLQIQSHYYQLQKKRSRRNIPNITNTINSNETMVKELMAKKVIRTATTEFLFTSLSSIVVKEAERQLSLIFQNVSSIPKNLITVHIRWGDKKTEMVLVSIQKYIDAIYQILNIRKEKRKQETQQTTTTTTTTGSNNTTTDSIIDENENDDKDIDNDVNIFLATEDPIVVKEFMLLKPKHWNIYLDQYYIETIQYRINEYNGNTKMAKQLKGANGLIAIASLLIAMESNDFVLTTASNWSRLINELRISIIESRCNNTNTNCTTMIDLRYDIGW